MTKIKVDGMTAKLSIIKNRFVITFPKWISEAQIEIITTKPILKRAATDKRQQTTMNKLSEIILKSVKEAIGDTYKGKHRMSPGMPLGAVRMCVSLLGSKDDEQDIITSLINDPDIDYRQQVFYLKTNHTFSERANVPKERTFNTNGQTFRAWDKITETRKIIPAICICFDPVSGLGSCMAVDGFDLDEMRKMLMDSVRGLDGGDIRKLHVMVEKENEN